jgi:transposase
VDAAGVVTGRDQGVAAGTGRGGPARLVTGDRGRFPGRGEKGGAKVARTLTGKQGSRFHLAVDANGLPLEIRLAAGNENERRHLLPLLDALAARGIVPAELWADRGYHSRELETELRQRGIEPRISQPRRHGDPIDPDTIVGEVWRGKKRRIKTRDPHARHRWPVERTNAWLRNRRRINTRRDRNPDTYEAFLQLAIILILTRAF